LLTSHQHFTLVLLALHLLLLLLFAYQLQQHGSSAELLLLHWQMP
jgi:hypothetical protein